jgi:hypothetical protein
MISASGFKLACAAVRFGAFGVGSVAGLATRPVSGAGGLAGPAVPVQYKGAKGHPIRAAVARGHWTTVPKRSVCQCSGIQLKAEQRLHSPAHRRRRDSERQETWWLEHWQRESAQGLRARLRRWNLQRRVLHVPLQCSRRDRAGSATEARASANMPVAQGCGCEAAITGMSCKPVHWSTLAALRLTGLPVQSKPQSL